MTPNSTAWLLMMLRPNEITLHSFIRVCITFQHAFPSWWLADPFFSLYYHVFVTKPTGGHVSCLQAMTGLHKCPIAHMDRWVRVQVLGHGVYAASSLCCSVWVGLAPLFSFPQDSNLGAPVPVFLTFSCLVFLSCFQDQILACSQGSNCFVHVLRVLGIF